MMNKPLFVSLLILLFITIFFTVSNPVYAEVRVWAAGSTEKIQQDNRAHPRHDNVWNENTKTVSLSGVKGEHIPFQVVITADRVNVSGITLKTTELRSGSDIISLENIDLYFEHMIKVYTPSGLHGKKGYYPDALVPLTHPFDIRSGGRGRGPQLRHQPVWVDIVVPRRQKPGIYKGTITIFSSEGTLDKINVELKIWDITMPVKRHNLVRLGLSDSQIAEMHGMDRDTPEFRDLFFKYMEFYLDKQMDPRFAVFGLRGKIENDNFILEWPDERLEKFLFEKGQSLFMVSPAPPGIRRESGETPFSEKYERYIRQHVEQVIAHSRRIGWYDRLVFSNN